VWTFGLRLALAGVALFVVAACGGNSPAPTATTLPPPATAVAEVVTGSDAGGSAVVAADGGEVAPVTVTSPPTVAIQATPVISLPVVEENTAGCAVESDLDLQGFPDLQQVMGCPLHEAIFDAVGINEFGEGPDYNRFMLWFGADLQIYVLFPDQSWQAYNDTWVDGEPEYSCNPLDINPSSPPLPRRGFGKLWCTVDGLQEVMGTIPREERLCQHTVVQSFENGRLLACFEDATIRYFRLLNDGAWDLLIVQ
jgi:hypothetical protein